MKWNNHLKPEEGETRTSKSWAIIPTKVFDANSNHYCWIWLEKYYVLEVYKYDWSAWAGNYKWKVEKRFIK